MWKEAPLATATAAARAAALERAESGEESSSAEAAGGLEMDEGVTIDVLTANMGAGVVGLGVCLEGGSAGIEEKDKVDGGGGRCTERRDLRILEGCSGGAMIGGGMKGFK